MERQRVERGADALRFRPWLFAAERKRLAAAGAHLSGAVAPCK